jgi:hypothetical protein
VKFKKATKFESKLKLAFIGPAGSGKTYSALAVGCALAKLTGTRMAVIDTERGSASLYAGDFDFDVLELATFSPLAYVEAIKAAEKEGYGVIAVDSLSHAWTGKEGALEQADRFSKREQGNTFAAWRHVTPMHNLMVDALVSSTSHLIATMRVKTEYVVERNEKTGKTAPRKVGLAPVQRDGLEYEFSIVGDLDIDNGFTVTKTRCSMLAGAYISKPGAPLAEALVQWLHGEQRPAEPVPADPELDRGVIFALIESAPDEASLQALVPELAKLPDPPRSEARKMWAMRREEIRQGIASERGVEHRPSASEPDDIGTVRIPDESPRRGNDGAKEAVQRAIGKGGTL